MATWASQQDGDWSRTSDNADSPWYDNGAQTALAAIPDDGDTVSIGTSGHDLVFDVDQSAWVTGLSLSISAGASLTVKDDAGDYYMMMKSGQDISLNGTLQAGTDEDTPFTGTFTIDFMSGGGSILINDTTGHLYLYCQEPTNKYVQLSAAEAADQTVLSVDTDLTADIWADDDVLCVCDLLNTSTTRDNELVNFASCNATTITVDGGAGAGGGIAAAKVVGAYIVLVTRNIRIINSTDYVIKNGNDSYIAAEISNCSYGPSSLKTSTLGGVILLNAGVASYALYTPSDLIIDGIITQASGSGNGNAIFSGASITTTSDSAIIGCYQAFSAVQGAICNGVLGANRYAAYQGNSIVFNGDLIGNYLSFYLASTIYVHGDVYNTATCFSRCTDIICANNELGKVWPDSGITSTNCNSDCGNGTFYNVTFTATNEFDGYNDTYRYLFNYLGSFDHNTTENAYKAWCRGGIVTSQTASPPSGYTIWYELAIEDNDQAFPCFRQYETVVQPGAAIEVEGLIRIADGEDLSTSGKEPQLQIIDKFADPLVDDTQIPLDYDLPADCTGAETDWQAVSVIWANQGDAPRNVIIRMIAYNDGLAAVDVDTVWAVATYKDQIQSIYDKLPTNYIMGSSDQDDHDTDIDAILVDTGTTLDGKLDTAQADLDIITGTNGVLIDDDAITSDKFDEITAFPIESADTGSTEIARTGADSDTLETLSDQIDDVQSTVDTIEANTGKVVYGTSYTSAGEKRTIADGSVTGFVEDEKL